MVQNVGENKSCGKPRKKKTIWNNLFFQLSKNGLFERVEQSGGGGGGGEEEVQERCTLKK